MTYQVRKIGDQDWIDDPLDYSSLRAILPGYEYRIKPEPAAPKWPKVKMTVQQYANIFLQGRRWPDIADDVLAHACETAQVVPAEVHNERMQSESRRWSAELRKCVEYERSLHASAKSPQEFLSALQAGARRERELGDMLHEAVSAVHELDPNRKVQVPTPKPTVCMSEFRPAMQRAKEKAEDRDMALATKVSFFCFSKYPYIATMGELQEIIDKTK